MLPVLTSAKGPGQPSVLTPGWEPQASEMRASGFSGWQHGGPQTRIKDGFPASYPDERKEFGKRGASKARHSHACVSFSKAKRVFVLYKNSKPLERRRINGVTSYMWQMFLRVHSPGQTMRGGCACCEPAHRPWPPRSLSPWAEQTPNRKQIKVKCQEAT